MTGQKKAVPGLFFVDPAKPPDEMSPEERAARIERRRKEKESKMDRWLMGD
jgi:hypothetical protein